MASKAALTLDNELSFPLYAAAKEMTRRYNPHLEKLDLTYTQYLAMLALWQHGQLTVSGLGELMHLDSGTLTPLLKKLEAKGYVVRTRSLEDERRVSVALTDEGARLKQAAGKVHASMKAELDMDEEDVKLLRMTLNWLLGKLEETDPRRAPAPQEGEAGE
ncbi:MAG: MarR family winged helix-turn-helix transcriptional regulator [Coriobacteriales bacterium]